MKKLWIWGLLTLTTACAGATVCADLSVDDCAMADECAVLRARQLGDDGSGNPCVDPAAEFEELACMDDMSCASAEEIAEDEMGQQWIFPSTCLPNGFVSVGSYAPDCP